MDKRVLLERLFAEYGNALRGFFHKRLRCQSEAAELYQELYLRMARLPDLEAIRNPVAYLFTVAGNLLREHASQERRRQNHIDVDDPAAQEQLAEMVGFGTEIDAEQRTKRLREVLGELRPKCHAAVVLAYWHDLSYQEIALKLDISTNMVKKYLRQGLDHCRRRMARLGEG